jgi:hypothetical protein
MQQVSRKVKINIDREREWQWITRQLDRFDKPGKPVSSRVKKLRRRAERISNKKDR